MTHGPDIGQAVQVAAARNRGAEQPKESKHHND